MFLLWIRCQHTQALLNLTLFFFLVVVTFEFISSALSLRMWQFEGEDLLQDDPNMMDFLMGLEDVFTEGVLGCNQQHPTPPTPPHQVGLTLNTEAPFFPFRPFCRSRTAARGSDAGVGGEVAGGDAGQRSAQQGDPVAADGRVEPAQVHSHTRASPVPAGTAGPHP